MQNSRVITILKTMAEIYGNIDGGNHNWKNNLGNLGKDQQ